eukprot:4669365-Alexandrium_andersonii.AAC.1
MPWGAHAARGLRHQRHGPAGPRPARGTVFQHRTPRDEQPRAPPRVSGRLSSCFIRSVVSQGSM